jgi:hypothetical protein
MTSLHYGRRAGGAAILALAVGGVLACTTATAPHLVLSGTWTAELPPGSEILLTAQQHGSTVTGTVTNVGPLSNNPSPLTGTVTNRGVTLAFSYPPGSAYGPAQSAVPWTFQGEFTSSTTITGVVSSATGITGQMVITQNTGPLPL